MLDGLLQVRHENEVASLEPVVVKRVMVDVREDGAGTQPVGAVLGVHELAELLHDLHARHNVLGDHSLTQHKQRQHSRQNKSI